LCLFLELNLDDDNKIRVTANRRGDNGRVDVSRLVRRGRIWREDIGGEVSYENEASYRAAHPEEYGLVPELSFGADTGSSSESQLSRKPRIWERFRSREGIARNVAQEQRKKSTKDEWLQSEVFINTLHQSFRHDLLKALTKEERQKVGAALE